MSKVNEKLDRAFAFLAGLGWHPLRINGRGCFVTVRDLEVEVLTAEQAAEGLKEVLGGNFKWRVRRPAFLVNGEKYAMALPQNGDRVTPTAERRWTYLCGAHDDYNDHRVTPSLLAV